MSIENNDSTLITKWIAGESLTKDELKQLKISNDLESYERILNEVDTWSLPDLKNDTLSSIQNKTINTTKVIPLYARKSFLVAASFLLILGIFSIFQLKNNQTIITTAANEIKTIHLIDGSTVTLNEKSSVSYDPQNWEENRNIELEGNAYFEVKKGNDFTVDIATGSVKVLGTRFEIISDESLFTTFCYEGKVATSITESNFNVVLTKGMGVIKQYNHTAIQYLDDTKTSPRWVDESVNKNYINAPLAEVIYDLKNNFNIEVEAQISLDRKFTGTFDKTDLEKALKMITLPLNIKYQIISEKKVILK